MISHNYDLNTSLIKFTHEPESSDWRLYQALQHVCIWGSTGAGKSTTSAKLILHAYLRNGFGGLVLSVKDERDDWISYCKETGRLEDLIIIEPGNNKNIFNFLEYESIAKDGSISPSESIVQVLKTVITASEEKSNGKSDDSFWENALDAVLFHTVELCQLAFGKVTVQSLYEIALSAPKQDKADNKNVTAFEQAFTIAQDKINKKIDILLASLPSIEKDKLKDVTVMEEFIIESIPEAALLKRIDQFFLEQYRNLSSKTKSIVDFSFSSFLLRLLRDPVYSLFSKKSSTVTPEDCYQKGKIVLINLPVKKFDKIGRDVQILVKDCFQRAWEKRNIKENPRCCFIFSDEAQHFISAGDNIFQATARSSRISVVYITQNIPSYYANMAAARSEHKLRSFLANFGTHFFHANTDLEVTNRFASELIGRDYFEDVNKSTSGGKNFSFGRSSSYKLEYMVKPEDFAYLKTGGIHFNNIVEAYIYVQSHPFKSGYNFKKITFKQTNL